MPGRAGSIPRSPPPVTTTANRATAASTPAPAPAATAAPSAAADGFDSGTVLRDQAAQQLDSFYQSLSNVVDERQGNTSTMRETMGDERMNKMLADAKAKCEELKGKDLTPQQLDAEMKKIQYRVKTDVMFERMAGSQFMADMLAIGQKAKDKYKTDE